jgi:AcrR family transcriptional regulator
VSVSATFAEPEPLTPDSRRHSRRQHEVLDVVETVFLREGIHAVRIGELAAEASCSRSTLYELAPSKEALLLLVLDRMMRRIMRRGAQAINRASDPVARVRAMLTSGALDFAALGPQFLEAVRQHPPARLLFDRRISEGRDALEQLIEDAITAGQFRPVSAAVVAEAIIAILIRFTDPQFARSSKINSTTGLAELVDVLLDGLRPRTTPVDHPSSKSDGSSAGR